LHVLLEALVVLPGARVAALAVLLARAARGELLLLRLAAVALGRGALAVVRLARRFLHRSVLLALGLLLRILAVRLLLVVRRERRVGVVVAFLRLLRGLLGLRDRGRVGRDRRRARRIAAGRGRRRADQLRRRAGCRRDGRHIVRALMTCRKAERGDRGREDGSHRLGNFHRCSPWRHGKGGPSTTIE